MGCMQSMWSTMKIGETGERQLFRVDEEVQETIHEWQSQWQEIILML